MRMYDAEGPQLLADAIVLQAVIDYRKAKARLKKNRQNQYAKDDIAEVRRFFRSEWFIALTGVEGEVILEKLDKGDVPNRRMISV